jgi:uncharacterized membrane protein YkvA (DUF1232 family)
MLFQLVNKLSLAFQQAQAVAFIKPFSQMIRSHTPDAAGRNAEVLACAALRYVFDSARIIETLLQIYQNPTTTLAYRASIACSLAYLVQPNDVLPDDSPGGFGFLDDAILLRYTLPHNCNVLPPGVKSVEDEKTVLCFLTACMPAEAIERLVPILSGISMRLQILNTATPEFLELFHQQCISMPLEFAFPQMGWEYQPDPNVFMSGPSIKENVGKAVFEACGPGFSIRFPSAGRIVLNGEQILLNPL